MKIHDLEGDYTAEAYNSLVPHRDGFLLGGWNASPDTALGGPFVETRSYTILDENLEVLKSEITKEVGVINYLAEILRFDNSGDTYAFVGRTNVNTPA